MMVSFSLFTTLAVGTLACGVPEIHDRSAALQKTAIENVHAFDGSKFATKTSTVVIIGNIITNANPVGATIVDGKGGYLMPGLIDAHCHVTDCEYLTTMREYGITTALDMGSFPYSAVSSCEELGVTDIKGTGAAGTVNGTKISLIPGFPTDSFISTPAAGRKFVADRLAEGVDFIKLFLDPLGPDDATMKAVITAAHAAHKLVISHATTLAAYAQAARTGVDIITHAPVDAYLTSGIINNMTSDSAKIVPTLIMMQSTINNTGAPFSLYGLNATASVKSTFVAKIPIAVGTDSNTSPYVPANPPFGSSLHDELKLLVAAGLSPAEALAGATSVAASMFRLYDRGTIKAGLRADLVLLSADPTMDCEGMGEWDHGLRVTVIEISRALLYERVRRTTTIKTVHRQRVGRADFPKHVYVVMLEYRPQYSDSGNDVKGIFCTLEDANNHLKCIVDQEYSHAESCRKKTEADGRLFWESDDVGEGEGAELSIVVQALNPPGSHPVHDWPSEMEWEDNGDSKPGVGAGRKEKVPQDDEEDDNDDEEDQHLHFHEPSNASSLLKHVYIVILIIDMKGVFYTVEDVNNHLRALVDDYADVDSGDTSMESDGRLLWASDDVGEGDSIEVRIEKSILHPPGSQVVHEWPSDIELEDDPNLGGEVARKMKVEEDEKDGNSDEDDELEDLGENSIYPLP